MAVTQTCGFGSHAYNMEVKTLGNFPEKQKMWGVCTVRQTGDIIAGKSMSLRVEVWPTFQR